MAMKTRKKQQRAWRRLQQFLTSWWIGGPTTSRARRRHPCPCSVACETLEIRDLLAPLIDVGDHVLLADAPNPPFDMEVDGADDVQGLNLFLQVEDGGPEAGGVIDGPAISGADVLTDTVFAENNTGEAGSGSLVPQFWQSGTTTRTGTVRAQGLLARVSIDTTGFPATHVENTFVLRLSDTLMGDSDFGGPNPPALITNGRLILKDKPTAVITQPGSVPAGQSLPLDGSGSHPWDPNDWIVAYEWDLDGDGIFGELGADATRGDERGATPTFSATSLTPGTTWNVKLRVKDNNFAQNPLFVSPVAVAQVRITVANPSETFVVTQLNPTDSGFVVTFNRDIDPDSLNLFETQATAWGSADLEVLDSAGRLVTGSLVPGSQSFTFVATGEPLPAGNYVVRLRSASNGFRDLDGELLDGDHDGIPGEDYLANVVINAAEPVVVSLPDFTRGPSQPVNLPPFGLGCPDALGGVPVRFSDANGIGEVEVTIHYNASLLNITNAVPGPDAPASSAVQLTSEGPGQVAVRFSNETPLPAGPADLFRLVADVPAAAAYGAAHVVDIIDVVVNGGAIPATADDAIHAAAYFGEVTGNRDYSGLDAQRTARVAVGLDGGFEAYPVIDPLIIADVTGNAELSGLDAQRVAQEAVGLDPPEIPPIPQPQRLSEDSPRANSARRLTGEPLGSGFEGAVARIESTGLDARIMFDSVRTEVVDRPGDLLDLTSHDTIRIDIDAAGHGWFIYATPWDDGRFADRGSGHDFIAVPETTAVHRADLLTVVLYELGHLPGYGHSDGGVMVGSLPMGTLRVCGGEWLFDDLWDLGTVFESPGLTLSVVDNYFAAT